MTNSLVALVVEDEAFLRFTLAQTLQEAGFITHEAADVAEAIRVLESNSDIRVVFTDIQMPGSMDGLALSHYVRKRWPPTIIVVTSGRCTPTKDEMASGAMFLAKPFAPDRLDKVLAAIQHQLC